MTQIEIDFTPKAEAIGAKDLTASDLLDLGSATRKIYGLMRDGKWHSRQEIMKVAGQAEAMRRLRALRQWFDIDTQRRDRRNYFYRLRRK